MLLFSFLAGIAAGVCQALSTSTAGGAHRMLPLADMSKRSFHAGVTPAYEWLRDASIQCTKVASLTNIDSIAMAMELCDRSSDCEAFVYAQPGRTADLCRGLDTTTVSRASGTVVGIKPFALAVAKAAVLTNQMALCPPERVLAEFKDVKSIDEASNKCESIPGCSHFSLDLAGSRSTPKDKQRLVVCSGDAVAVPREGAITVVRTA